MLQWRLHATPLHRATYPDHLSRGSGRARRARNACGMPIGCSGGALWTPQCVMRAPVRQNGSGGGSPMAEKSGRPPAQGCPEWGPRGAAPAGGLLGTLCWHPCLSGPIHTIHTAYMRTYNTCNTCIWIEKDTYTIHTIHTYAVSACLGQYIPYIQHTCAYIQYIQYMHIWIEICQHKYKQDTYDTYTYALTQK